jgi:glycosyltransferase involved in cell wall biosynthesis
MRILLAYPSNRRATDGIRDYARCVVAELKTAGDEAILLRPKPGVTLPVSLAKALPRRTAAVLVIEYNPFSWGRWGVAPALLAAVLLVRLLRPQIRVVLTVHESHVPIRTLRSLLTSVWQRTQVRILLWLAHGANATSGTMAAELSRGWPQRRVTHVPTGSNMPDQRSSRHLERVARGYEGRLVIATFTAGHETHLYGHVASAAEAIAHAVTQPVVLLLLGSHNVPPVQIRGVERVVSPGYLDERALARALSTADLFLAPFAEGATARRSTLMAAIQHGVPVVTTSSERTEPSLLNGNALAFATDGADGFAAVAVSVATDVKLRERLSDAGRALYDRHFSWTAVCGGLRTAIAAVAEVRSQ